MEEFLKMNFDIINILLKIPSTIFNKLNPKYRLIYKNNQLIGDNIIIYRNKIITNIFIILIDDNFTINKNDNFMEYISNNLSYEFNINNIELRDDIIISYIIKNNFFNFLENINENLILDYWINLHI